MWILFGLGPVVFLGLIVAASIYFGATSGTTAQAIAERVTGSTPYLLLIVEIVLLLGFLATVRSERVPIRLLGWRLHPGQHLWREAFVGVASGSALAGLYLSVLSPLMTTAQRLLGDYVPAGELLPALGTSVLPFFLANVVLAPFVEENIYRGYGITRLRQRFTTPAAIAISCVFFGLLHWAGGFWYIVLTGSVAGGCLAALFVWRKNIVAPYAAHLTLNAIEFVYVWLIA